MVSMLLVHLCSDYCLLSAFLNNSDHKPAIVLEDNGWFATKDLYLKLLMVTSLQVSVRHLFVQYDIDYK